MPYQPTWNNPYLPQSTAPMGQSFNAQYGPQYNLPTQYQQPVNGTIKVSGPDSALQYGYRMPPNSTSGALFDLNGKVFYVVSTDGAGVPSLETFDYFPHKEEEPVRIDGAQFVSRQEYDQFVAKVGAALEALNGVHGPVQTAVPTGAAAGTQGENGNVKADDAR